MSLLQVLYMNLSIKNIKSPSCTKCVHFIKDTHALINKHNEGEFGKCKLFGKMDVVSGEIEHDYAVICREHLMKCGQRGNYFKRMQDDI